MAKKYRIEIKWAFIFMAVLLGWMVLERLAGLHDKHIVMQQYITWGFLIPAIWVYVLTLKDKKKNFYNGQMTYSQGFMAGLIMTVVVTIFSPLNQWIVSYIITPHYFDNVIAYSVEHGYNASLEEAQAFFNYKNYAIQSTIWALVMGVVFSLIIAAFVRSKK